MHHRAMSSLRQLRQAHLVRGSASTVASMPSPRHRLTVAASAPKPRSLTSASPRSTRGSFHQLVDTETPPAVRCADVSPNVLYVTGTSNFPPLVEAVQPFLLEASPAYTIIFLQQNSCLAASEIYDPDPAKHVIQNEEGNWPYFYDADGNLNYCSLADGGVSVDVGVSDVYPETCGYQESANVADYSGPVEAVTFVVPAGLEPDVDQRRGRPPGVWRGETTDRRRLGSTRRCTSSAPRTPAPYSCRRSSSASTPRLGGASPGPRRPRSSAPFRASTQQAPRGPSACSSRTGRTRPGATCGSWRFSSRARLAGTCPTPRPPRSTNRTSAMATIQSGGTCTS